jgi:uncharacterized C2H2 Zn-finger protein
MRCSRKKYNLKYGDISTRRDRLNRGYSSPVGKAWADVLIFSDGFPPRYERFRCSECGAIVRISKSFIPTCEKCGLVYGKSDASRVIEKMYPNKKVRMVF